MNVKDKILNDNELGYKSPEDYKVYDPIYTPNEKSQTSDNQSFKSNKYFYIESYGC